MFILSFCSKKVKNSMEIDKKAFIFMFFILLQCSFWGHLSADNDAVDFSDQKVKTVFWDSDAEEEGCPRRNTLGSYVVLTNLQPTDEYYQAVIELSSFRKAKKILFFKKEDIWDLIPVLKKLAPEYVTIITRPETIDVNFAYDILEMSVRLDSDPFPDFLYGFITGATAEDALNFVRNIIQAEQNPKKFPAKILEFAPSNQDEVEKNALSWARGYSSLSILHKQNTFPEKYISELSENAIIKFSGHGCPCGIDSSLMRKNLKNLNIYPAVVFGGPCYTGVTSGSFKINTDDEIEHQSIKPEDSFCLGLIKSGATAYIAALHSSKCIFAGQEMENALYTGNPMGHVLKSTYDSIILALQTRCLKLSRFEKDQIQQEMSGVWDRANDACSRILFGDPAFQVIQAVGTFPVSIETKIESGAISIKLKTHDILFNHSFRDLLHIGFGGTSQYNDRLVAKIELPDNFTSAGYLRAIKAYNPSLSIVPILFYCALEKWGGKKYLHIQVDLAHQRIKNQKNTVEIEIQEDATLVIKNFSQNAQTQIIVRLLGREACKQYQDMKTILEELAKDYKGSLSIELFDLDKEAHLSKDYALEEYPTMIFYDKDRNEIFFHGGILDKAHLQSLLKDLGLIYENM